MTMSVIQRKTAKTKLVISTTMVVAVTSSRDGKDTFRISTRVSARKSLVVLIHSFMSAPVPRVESGEWQARRDSNPQPSVLETDALPVRATGLFYRLLLPAATPIASVS